MGMSLLQALPNGARIEFERAVDASRIKYKDHGNRDIRMKPAVIGNTHPTGQGYRPRMGQR